MKQNKNILRAALLLLLVIVAPEARAQQLITDNGDGTYTITMPAGNVTVTADVKKLLAHKDISVEGIADQDWTGSAIEPAIVVKDARIAELEAQVAELTPFKSQAEALEAEKAAAELAAKQTELTHFAEAQGLDPKAEAVAAAIQNVDYAALIAEVNKNGKPGMKPVVASYAMGGIAAKGEYDDLLEKA